MYFSVIIIFKLISSIVSLTLFCTNDTRNSLVDTVFSAKGIIYAFRKPNVWLIEKNRAHNWYQIGDAFKLQDLFKDFPHKSFDGAIVMTDIVRCNDSVIDCPYSSPEFDPSNITLIFFGENFYIYRRINEGLFTRYEWGDRQNTTIPWKLKESESLSIKRLFAIENDVKRIDGAVYMMPKDMNSPIRKLGLLYKTQGLQKFKEYNIGSESLTQKEFILNPGLTGQPMGGMSPFAKDLTFISDNTLYSLELKHDFQKKSMLYPKNKTAWQFFNCDTLKVEESTLTTNTTTSTTIQMNSTSQETNTTSTTNSMTTSTTTMAAITTTKSYIPIETEKQIGQIDIVEFDEDREYRRNVLTLTVR
ncbi:uncharacterized protein LOC128966306 [Oppia nitens]|uniref:uncharacterized protein LOC128966306 n=1 Tax=Oppia nitens TaxID=1686743 RepID=UPI0023DB457A|nr:uncharacterized protein LOC128966306 [Oppia nitens]